MPVTSPQDNRVLASLTPAHFERLAAVLEPVAVNFKQEVARPENDLDHVYFPSSTLVSILHPMEDGRSVEVASIGRNGVVGLRALFGEVRTEQRFVAQTPGEAFRLPFDVFARESQAPGPLHDTLIRYTGALLFQQAQWTACSILHTVEQRCCRWLLMVHDRTGREQFPLTHDFLAQMLGVRRASVTEVARALQKSGLVAYRRGEMTLADLPGLEKAACECHRRVKAEFARLLP